MRTYRIIFILFLLILTGCQKGKFLNLHAQRLVKSVNGKWGERPILLKWKPQNTAIIICDMWNRHWCDGATARVAAMAPLMNRVIKAARKKGIIIIHAPSGTMDFYKDFPQRKIMENAPIDSSSLKIRDWYYLDPTKESALPIDDSDGGCDTNAQPEHYEVWTRENPSIEIDARDGISDSGKEINNYFVAHGIRNVILMGVHLNMCVLGRSFGVRGQVALGRNVVVVRDLTDAMYNPAMSPRVSHETGVRLMLQHIEKFWCPTIESRDLL